MVMGHGGRHDFDLTTWESFQTLGKLKSGIHIIILKEGEVTSSEGKTQA